MHVPREHVRVIAAEVVNTPAGNIFSTNVQAALNELDTEKVATTALATSTGAGGVGFLQAGTDAINRSLQTKVREVSFSVKDFGAVGDGDRDDTYAIQLAFDSVPTGSTIYFPTGIYVVSSGLAIGNKTLIIRGDGYCASIGAYFGTASLKDKSLYSGTAIFSNVTSGVALDLNPTSTWAVHLRGLAIVGPGSGSSLGVRARSATIGNALVGCVWENVLVVNFYNGVELSAVLNSEFRRMRVVGISNKGLTITAYNRVGANNNTFLDFESYFTGEYGIYQYDSGGSRFVGSLIQNTTAGKMGIYFGESTPNNNNDNMIILPWLEHGQSDGLVRSIFVNGGRNTQVLSAHCGTQASIIFNAGTGHQLLGKSRFTSTGNVFTIFASATNCIYDSREIDLDGIGVIVDNGTRSLNLAVRPSDTYANISTSTATVNTIGKYSGKEVWDTTYRRTMRADGVNPNDRWYAVATPFYVQPGGKGAAEGGQLFLTGAGSPVRSNPAPIGSLYVNISSDGASDTLWVKESGTGTAGWIASMANPSEQPAADIASARAAVNTTNKRAGKFVWDTDNHCLMRAEGANATDTWYRVDGLYGVTPS